MKTVFATTIALASFVACLGCGGDGGGGSDPGTTSPDIGPLADAIQPDDVAFEGVEPDSTTPEDVPAEASDPGPAEVVNPRCKAGMSWKAGTPAFKEATAEWGLDDTGALAIRVSAVDFDGDGRPDLFVRLNGTAGDDFADGGKRVSWLLRNEGGRFVDVTKSSNIRATRAATDATKGHGGEVVAFADVDNDGDLDAYIGLAYDAKTTTGETSEIYLNKGDGTFELGPENSALRVKQPQWDSPAGASFTDFDRDGNVDLWVAQYADANGALQDHLYRNDGTGVYTDVTKAQGLETGMWMLIGFLNQAKGHSLAWGSTACDLNGDGNPELLAASYGRAPNHLWQNGGPAAGFVYSNRSVASGYAFDDRKDWSDNESARCWCKLHPTDTGCEGVPAPTGIVCTKDSDAFRWDHANDREPWRLGGNSATTVCGDVNNDGHMDLLTGEIVHWDVGSSSDPAELMVNTGEPDVRFSRPGNDVTGLARTHTRPDWNEGIMTGALLDFDNDGRLDVYWGDSDYPGSFGLLYHQDAPGHFVPVPKDVGIDHHRSHGVTVADFDRDGDLDVVVGHSFARCSGDTSADSKCYETQRVRLFENVIGSDGNFVELTLEGGAGTNRAAIGARVSLVADGLTQTREIDGGHGHYGTQDDLTVHFGLGASCAANATIRWPDAALTTQTFQVLAGYRYKVVQGQAPVVIE